MALLFMEGFDQLTSMAPADVNTALAASGYAPTGALAVVEGRNVQTQALSIGGTAVGSLTRTFNSSQSKVVLAFAYLAAKAREDIVTIPGLGTLSWSKDTGKISMAGTAGQAILLVNLWYYFEIVLDKTAKTVTVWVNNGQDLLAVMPSSAEFQTTFDVKWDGPKDSEKRLDDLTFIDSSTGKYQDRVGPIQITSRLPGIDVDKEWSPSSGSEHWALVDNMPPDPDAYIQSNVSGATDTFLSNTPVPALGTVLAVGMTVYNRKSDIDARQLGMVIGRKGEAQKEVIDANLSTTPKYSYAVFETAPGSAAWTGDNVLSLPFGVIVRP